MQRMKLAPTTTKSLDLIFAVKQGFVNRLISNKTKEQGRAVEMLH